ncbi:apoptosis-inducing factor 3-like [Watersipora subatra]|uniref:apoptosis-inducing factor 3-like n=1 Tax=Watersipora subatra TaxID=2589382 RepID=UPI00355C5D9D
MGNSQSGSADVSGGAATAGTGASSKKPSKGEEKPPKPVQQVLCDYDELVDGQMKEVEVEGHKVLLARDQGAYYAVSPKCTHFGAPLVKGALCKGRVRCPWHGACFDLTTGDIEDFPGLDSLQSFEVQVKDGKVEINTDTAALATTKRVKKMLTRDLECTLLYLIVGGGPASLECAEALRQEGYKGKIMIVTNENDPPYDRTKLSKSLTSTAAELALRNEEFYKVYDITVKTGMEAFAVDTEMNHMSFKGHEYTDFKVEYDQAAICTGSSPIELDVPGVETFSSSIHYLRTPHDANQIAKNSDKKNVVIVGSAFIGMEVAAFLCGKAKSVTVLGRSSLPFARVLGERVGKIVLDMFEAKGVKMIMNSEVEELLGNDDTLKKVKLTSGETVDADLCIVGIGVKPNTKWLEGSGVKLSSSGHIEVSKYNKTSVGNIYAGGDCTTFPLFIRDDEMHTVGHYHMALSHGKSAGMNMCHKDEELRTVPYFWTVIFGKSFRYCGTGKATEAEVVFHGEDTKFVAFYVKDEVVVAVASLGWDPLVSVAAELMRVCVPIPAAKIRENPEELHSLIPK